MAVESFPASSLRTKIMGAKVSPAPDQPRPSIGSRNRFMVNSIFCDCSSRQLSTSVMYRSFGKRSKYSKASLLAVLGFAPV